jgi:hypothetical protein
VTKVRLTLSIVSTPLIVIVKHVTGPTIGVDGASNLDVLHLHRRVRKGTDDHPKWTAPNTHPAEPGRQTS